MGCFHDVNVVLIGLPKLELFVSCEYFFQSILYHDDSNLNF